MKPIIFNVLFGAGAAIFSLSLIDRNLNISGNSALTIRIGMAAPFLAGLILAILVEWDGRRAAGPGADMEPWLTSILGPWISFSGSIAIAPFYLPFVALFWLFRRAAGIHVAVEPQPHFVFRSDLFAPTPGELDDESEDYINPGIFGSQLADYMADELVKHGVDADRGSAEDWGVMVSILHDGGYSLSVCCTSYVEEEDLESGIFEHRVFVAVELPWFRKPLTDPNADARQLIAMLREILTMEKRITDLKEE